MPYLGAIIVLTRHDPAQPRRELPPFLVIDRTEIKEGVPDPIYADLLVGCLENDTNWELRFFEQARAAAVLNGSDRESLCSFNVAEIAHIGFNHEHSRFVITANRPLLERSGFVAQVIRAFELPPDECFIEVIVGPVPYTRMDELPWVSQLRYERSEYRILERPHSRVRFSPAEPAYGKPNSVTYRGPTRMDQKFLSQHPLCESTLLTPASARPAPSSLISCADPPASIPWPVCAIDLDGSPDNCGKAPLFTPLRRPA